MVIDPRHDRTAAGTGGGIGGGAGTRVTLGEGVTGKKRTNPANASARKGATADTGGQNRVMEAPWGAANEAVSARRGRAIRGRGAKGATGRAG